MLRKGIAQLLCGPGRRRMFGDRHVEDPSTVVREDHEYEEQPDGDRWPDEEVGGHDPARVIRQKRAPRLGRWTTPTASGPPPESEDVVGAID